MKTTVFAVPRMYADHHVVEVRRLLGEIEGVGEVYASSAFQIVEVTFEPKDTSEDSIRTALEEAGYLGELVVSVERYSGAGGVDGDGSDSLRHTTSYTQTRQTIGFAREPLAANRARWPWTQTAPTDRPAGKE